MRGAVLRIGGFDAGDQIRVGGAALMPRRIGVGLGDAALQIALAPQFEFLFGADPTLADAASIHVPRLQRDCRIGQHASRAHSYALPHRHPARPPPVRGLAGFASATTLSTVAPGS